MKLYYFDKEEEVRNIIKDCEGDHVQQVVFSTYHNAITQICFSCDVVRTTMPEKDVMK